MWGVLVKFFDGQTSFSRYESPITDIPTVTFCFIKTDIPFTQYEYGTDFTIKYLYEGLLFPEKSIFLLNDKKTNELGETVHVLKLQTYMLGFCYKVCIESFSKSK